MEKGREDAKAGKALNEFATYKKVCSEEHHVSLIGADQENYRLGHEMTKK